MEYVVPAFGSVICALLAIRAKRLLTAAVWLAGVSMFTALTLYLLGAIEVAVIELSVGAGLVTILFVFAITIAGEDAMQSRGLVPKPLAWLLIILTIVLLGVQMLPIEKSTSAISANSFTSIFWHDRLLDMLAQIALIFAGVLGCLGLLSTPEAHPVSTAASEDFEEAAEPPHWQSYANDPAVPEEEPV